LGKTMDERIQRALDGELQRGDLTAEESIALDQIESLIAGLVPALPARPLPDLGTAVLARLPARHAPSSMREASAGAGGIRGFIEWLWAPKPLSIRFRPVYGFALALGLALLVMGRAAFVARSINQVPALAQPVLIQFRLDAPNARNVALAGNFTDWKPAYTLTRAEPGIWTVVVPLAPGVHDYAFVVDGERWTPDPMAPAIDDGFGGLNSRLAVLSPDRRRRS
jgi:hypothetical protein